MATAQRLGDIAVGEIVQLNVGGNATDFIVVQHGSPSALYDDSCNGTWLLMKDIYEERAWHSTTQNSYSASTIHSYLNGAFLETLDDGIQSAVIQAKIPYVNGTGRDGSVASGANGLSARIFLLSGYEIGWTRSSIPIDGACLSYFGGASNSTCIADLNGTATIWWLRSPSVPSTSSSLIVLTDGGYSYSGCSDLFGIRPAMILPNDLAVKDGFIDGATLTRNLLGDVPIGEVVTMNVSGEAREFIVVQHGLPSDVYDSSCDGTWLLMKDVYERRAWHSSNGNNYGASTIHSYLNSTFFGLLDEDMQSIVVQAKIPYFNGFGTTGTVASGASGLSAQVFLLSNYEVGFEAINKHCPEIGATLTYFSGDGDTNANRIAYWNGNAEDWWLRAPYTYANKQAFTVSRSGIDYTWDCSYEYGIRPAMILPGELVVVDGAVSTDKLIPESIEVTKAPDKTEYKVGEAFESTGMVVTATMNDGSQKEVTDYEITNGDSLKAVQTSVTISYSFGDTTLTTTQSITVMLDYLGDAEVGTIVTLNVDDTPTEFIVVQQGKPSDLYDDSTNGTWLLMKDVYATHYFAYGGNAGYNYSALRSYLNGTFFSKLDVVMQATIIQAKIPYLDLSSTSNIAAVTGTNGDPLRCFALSVHEVGTSAGSSTHKEGSILDYFEGTAATDSKRIAYMGDSATTWWTRTGGTNPINVAYYVTNKGAFATSLVDGTTYTNGVRPAMILPYDVQLDTNGAIYLDSLTLDSIEITKSPDKTVYDAGETFDPTGMVVTATMKDGSTKEVADFEVMNGDPIMEGQTSVTISYTERGVTETCTQEITIDEVMLRGLEVGSIVTMNVNDTTTEFIVIQQGNPATGYYDETSEGTWLLMKDIYEKRQWHSSNNNKYASSSIHSYLNSTFFGLLDEGMQRLVKEVHIPYVNGTGSAGNPAVKENGLTAKIFLLSYRETGLNNVQDKNTHTDGYVLDYFVGSSSSYDPLRVAYLNGDATAWWTRSPVSLNTGSVKTINASGNTPNSGTTGDTSASSSRGVRPAMILPYNVYVENGSIRLDHVTPESIEVTTAPDKTEYVVGAAFESDGMVVTATMKDGSTKEVTGYTVMDGDSLAADQTYVTISYTENGVEVTTTQPIKIIKLESIEVTKDPDKTEYVSGDAFDHTGMQINAVYTNGTVTVLKNGEYEVLEYLESSGTQYIDTGFIPSSARSFRFSFDVAFLAESDNNVYGTGRTYAGFLNSMAQFAVYQYITQMPDVPFDTERHTFVLDGVNRIASVDNTSIALNVGTQASAGTWSLFAYDATHLNASRLWGSKLEENGVLVRDFIPARRLSDSVLGLYDKVNNVFYENAGEGEFIAGPSTSLCLGGSPEYTIEDGASLTSPQDCVHVSYGGYSVAVPITVYSTLDEELELTHIGAPVTAPGETYTVLEYLESTGTQYIDLDYHVGPKTEIEISFKTTGHTSTTWDAVFGARTDQSNTDAYAIFLNAAGNIALNFGGTNTSEIADTAISGTRVIRNDGAVVYQNDTAILSQTATPTAGAYSCYMFAGNLAGTMRPALMRGSYLKISEDGVLIHDYVSVRRESDGALGMYDRVTDIFRVNAGTGTFTAGPEMTALAADYGLPAEYTPLEYIASSGTQYIDTGFGSTAGWSTALAYAPNDPSVSTIILGNIKYSGNTYWREYVQAKNNQWSLGHYSNCEVAGSVSAGQRYEIEASTVSGNGYLKVDGEIIDSYTTTYAEHEAINTFLFADNYTPSTGLHLEMGAGGILYYCRLYDHDGTLVRDFVPAQRIADAVMGLYDKVNGAFYENVGTGAFTGQAAVRQIVIPYVTTMVAHPLDALWVAGDDIVAVITDAETGEQIAQYAACEVEEIYLGVPTAFVTQLADGTTKTEIRSVARLIYTGFKPFGLDTTFPSASSAWTVEGGTFAYSSNSTYPGLYQAAGSTKIGTIIDPANSSTYMKYMTTPVALQNFNGYCKTNLYSTAKSNLGSIRIAFLDENRVERMRITHSDSWSANYGQIIEFSVSQDGLTWNQTSPSYTFRDDSNPQNYRTGQSIENTFSYVDGVFTCTTKYYTSTSATKTATIQCNVDLPRIHYARVIFTSYSTYACPRMNLARLTLTPIE